MNLEIWQQNLALAGDEEEAPAQGKRISTGRVSMLKKSVVPSFEKVPRKGVRLAICEVLQENKGITPLKCYPYLEKLCLRKHFFWLVPCSNFTLLPFYSKVKKHLPYSEL